MNDLAPRIDSELAVFDPAKARRNDAKLDALIDYAKKVRDWPLLAEAIDQKLDMQGEFVAWWDKSVRDKGQNRNNADQRYFVTEAEQQTQIKQQQVSRWRNRLKDPEKYRSMLFETANAKAMAEKGNTTAAKWTGNPESYTPARYIEAAREVMGGIDLDPASNAFAQQTVKATRWHGVEADGLKQPWSGRVFLNPPYSHPEVANFVGRLCDECLAGNVVAAILLTNNNTDTRWWHQAARTAAGVCFTIGRINFYKDDGSETQPTNGQTFFYFGADAAAFDSVFSSFGLVMATR